MSQKRQNLHTRNHPGSQHLCITSIKQLSFHLCLKHAQGNLKGILHFCAAKSACATYVADHRIRVQLLFIRRLSGTMLHP